MYGKREVNRRVIGMLLFQIGQNKERSQSENIKNKNNHEFNYFFCICSFPILKNMITLDELMIEQADLNMGHSFFSYFGIQAIYSREKK